MRLVRRRSRKTGVYQKGSEARRVLIETAYRLFAKNGINAVSLETIAAKSGTAKVTLYRHFRSKEDLVLAVLDMHEERWSVRWLQTEVLQRTNNPRQRLLMIFTLFDEWFQSRDFLGCLFIRVLLEAEATSAPRQKAEEALNRLHEFLMSLASAAGLEQPERVAAIWHILMKGSIVSAHGGRSDAALEAKDAAKRLLETWPRSSHLPD